MIGRTFAQYHILEKLGEGSVGVVYKAEHIRLKHLVVLKFLRPEFAGDDLRQARFLREAEIAASLDSPSICSVIDYGEEADNTFYLVMRYCEGMSLKGWLIQGPLPIHKAVLYATQVAEGLRAAHAHGIVHRDIKPSNIIIGTHCDNGTDTLPTLSDDPEITTDLPPQTEQAKITDFGVAYLPDTTRLTVSQTLLGSPSYMSPEQVVGEEADARSDLWSLGAVLYEMVTGQTPFGSASPQAVMYAVQHRQPRPVAELRANVPPELLWVINKALRKEPNARYQDANQMLRDLRMVQNKIRTSTKRDRSTWVLESRGRLLAFAGGLLAIVTALIINQFVVPRSAHSPLQLGHPRQVTADMSWEGSPAVSPDGSQIAYASDQAGNMDLYLMPARGGQTLRLTDNPAQDTAPTWFPDGSALLFTSSRLNMQGVWKIGVLGGEPTLLVPRAQDPAVSPDGDRLAFSRIGTDGELRIFVAPIDRATEVTQLTFAGHGAFQHTQPAWSPDGTTICYATAHDLWVVSSAGDAPRPLTTGGIADSSPTWSPDGAYIFFSSARENTLALWRVKSQGGTADRLTPGSGPESDPYLANNGTVMAYTTGVESMNDDVVILAPDTGERHRIIGLEDAYQPALAADGSSVCYVSNRSEGRRELWLQDLDHGRPSGPARRLTNQSGTAAHPKFSPDGRWLAYFRIHNADRCVWVVPADGGPAHVFTMHLGENIHPTWSPDGNQLAFASDRDGVFSIYVAPVVEGRRAGDPIQITPDGVPATMPTWSPDGDQIAFVTNHEGHNEIWMVTTDGSRTTRHLELPAQPHMAHWDQTSNRLWVSAVWDGELGLRSVNPSTGEIFDFNPPIHFENDVPFAQFHADAAGHQVVYSRPLREGNIWILDAAGQSF